MPDATNEEVAARMRDDEIDILIELGGTTRYNRLEVLALRPAPAQVSWLGYPHSAGMAEIDYILVDPYLKPEDPKLLIEQPFLMPESWVCLGRLGFHDELRIEPGLPEERAGHLTFGTANNPYKFSAELVALWAKAMTQVPGSRFLLIRPEGGSAAFRKNIGDAFENTAWPPAAIDFEPVRGTHLPHYNRIDIALDSCPHTGGTHHLREPVDGRADGDADRPVLLRAPELQQPQQRRPRRPLRPHARAVCGDRGARWPPTARAAPRCARACAPRSAPIRCGQAQRWVRNFEDARHAPPRP